MKNESLDGILALRANEGAGLITYFNVPVKHVMAMGMIESFFYGMTTYLLPEDN